jgi:hypothetical protein
VSDHAASMEPVPKRPERELGLLRDDSVSAEAQTVHAMGQPISASTNCGFRTRPPLEVDEPTGGIVRTWRPRSAFTSMLPSSTPASHAAPVSFQSRTVGVAQRRSRTAASVSVVPCWCDGEDGHIAPLAFTSITVGVGQDEQPLSSVGSAGVGRSKHSPLRIEPQRVKITEDDSESPNKES